jgi:hypothetical protein
MIKVQKLLFKTSSMQLILGSIFIYFVASILIIYVHIISFLDYHSMFVTLLNEFFWKYFHKKLVVSDIFFPN